MRRELVTEPAAAEAGKPFRPAVFSNLSQKDLNLVHGAGISRRFNAGQVVVEEGAKSETCSFVVSGNLELSITVGNKPRTIGTLTSGDWYGTLYLPVGAPYRIVATGDASAFELSAKTVQHLPVEVQAAIARGVAQSLYYGVERLKVGASVETERLASLLPMVQQKHGTSINVRQSPLCVTLIDGIPKLPPNASELAVRLLNEKTSVQHVVDGIKQDPSLANIVLKTVNSA